MIVALFVGIVMGWVGYDTYLRILPYFIGWLNSFIPQFLNTVNQANLLVQGIISGHTTQSRVITVIPTTGRVNDKYRMAATYVNETGPLMIMYEVSGGDIAQMTINPPPDNPLNKYRPPGNNNEPFVIFGPPGYTFPLEEIEFS